MLIQVKNDFIQIDDNDYELIKNFKWNILEVTPNNKYATTYIERKLVLMHRLLMGFPKGKEIDHIDGNGLNNSRSNLRICSHKDNLRNRKINKNNKSGFKGVNYLATKGKKKWRSYIYVNGKTINLGYYLTSQEAAEAYEKASKEYFGEYARSV